MNKLICVLAFLPMVAVAQKQLIISGRVKGVKDHSMVFLNDSNSPKDTIAKAVVKDGAFLLKGSLRESMLVNLNFVDSKKKALFFLENGTIKVSGDINQVQKLEVSGSPAQNDFEEFQNGFNPLFEKYSKINQRAKTEGLTDSIQIQSARIYTTIQEKIEEFVNRHKASPVSPFLLLVTAQLNEDISIVENRYNNLDTIVKNNFYGKYLKDMIADSKIGAVGSEAIEFTQPDKEGKPVSLSSFKGKYVLVEFWASWCGPCRMENPNVVNTFRQFKDKNFTILGVSLDKAKEPWLKAISDDSLTWTQVSDLKFWNNEVAGKYRIQSIPQNFLIGPEGKIVAKNLRGDALKAKLCELLGCN